MKRLLSLLIVFSATTYYVNAQNGSRAFIRSQIEKWGECKNVAITLAGGDVAIYGNNGYAADGVPQNMGTALSELHESNEYIDDLVLTENGDWMILYGNNGIRSNGAPASLFNKLKSWNQEGEVIMSITFNDAGEWIAITETKYSASDERLLEIIRAGENKHGEFWAAHLTNDGLVLCFERGFTYLGNVPETLKNKLSTTQLDVFRIKFLSDGTYFIADFDGTFAYFM